MRTLEKNNAREVFRKMSMGKNLLTPEIIKYIDMDNCLKVEFSTGDFCGERLYGVTVLYVEDNKGYKVDRSKCFNSKAEAEDYINQLQKLSRDEIRETLLNSEAKDLS